MADQSARIEWRDGTIPVSKQFDDPYFSIADGLAETKHVFLAGNQLPARFTPGFHIAELGFGTGLNMLAAWDAWNGAGQTGSLKFTSFELYPMAKPDMLTALSGFPELGDLTVEFMSKWSDGCRSLSLPGLTLDLVIGDARQTLPDWRQNVDAWFLDGFSPAKNQQLWSPELLRSVGQHTNTGGTVATYSAAGHVRRSLSLAGFSVDRIAGFGRKRHMTIGKKTPEK